MGFDRRDFLKLTGVTVGSVMAFEAVDTDEYVDMDVDVDRLPLESNGHELNANVYVTAQYDGLEELELQIREPGEEAWAVLEEKSTISEESQMAMPYDPEEAGNYEFRALAHTSNNTYTSNIETLEVVEEI